MTFRFDVDVDGRWSVIEPSYPEVHGLPPSMEQALSESRKGSPYQGVKGLTPSMNVLSRSHV